MTNNEPVLAADVAEATLPEIPPTGEDLRRVKKSSSFSYRHAFPVHTKNIPSPLSKEAPPESYRGLVNLGSTYSCLRLKPCIPCGSQDEAKIITKDFVLSVHASHDKKMLTNMALAFPIQCFSCSATMFV